MRRMLAGLTVAVLLLGGNVPPAAADTRRTLDGDDARGPFDIRWVAHGHAAGDEADTKVRHRIETFASWKNDVLKCNVMSFSFGKRQRYVKVFYDGGLKAEMFDTSSDQPRLIGRTQVWRPTSSSLTVQFPIRWLGTNVASYRWDASTETYGGWCGSTGEDPHGDPPMYRDRAPDTRWIVHDLRS